MTTRMRGRASLCPSVHARKQAQNPAPRTAPAPGLSTIGAARPGRLSPVPPQTRPWVGPTRSKSPSNTHSPPRPPPTPAASSNARYQNCLGPAPATVHARLPPRQFRSTIARYLHLFRLHRNSASIRLGPSRPRPASRGPGSARWLCQPWPPSGPENRTRFSALPVNCTAKSGRLRFQNQIIAFL